MMSLRFAALSLMLCWAFTPASGQELFLGSAPAPELVTVPGADNQPDGPIYDFYIGRFEVTNAEYASFLNTAEFNNEIQNPGFGSELGEHLVFRPAPSNFGDVGIADGDAFSVKIFDISRSLLTYNSSLAVGARYGVVLDRDDHGATGMSWMGAVKFCNALTITEGLGLGARCYAEGTSEFDWFPVTIGDEIGGSQSATNAVRDLTPTERAALVADFRGYRLPMDQGGTLVGSVNAVARPYNEWFKAAAFDPAAPDIPRTAFPGTFEEHVVPADHWIHGYGRDPLFNADANFRSSGDPFDDPDPAVYATAPVGYYDGSLQGGVFQTSADANRYGLFDVSGSVWEFLTDQVDISSSLTPDRSIVGGSYRSNTQQVATANRGDIGPDSTRPVVGFRLLRVATAPAGDAWTDQGCALPGVSGAPLLVGTGTLAGGSANTVELSNGAPVALAGLFLALSSTPVPFKGGTLKPVPFLPPVFVNTSAAGGISLPFVMTAGLPVGTELWVQWGIQDSAAINSVALSNAIKGVTP
ncbi:MAG: sulfatase activating formylglycine-generating enzyme [Pseudohongiellaceae bacterium]|jgi:formylglycine-generating enzyme required for sulfatase activity